MSRTVVVVGGTSGIGLAIAEGFVEDGAHVSVTGHEAVTSGALRREMADHVLDVRVPEAVDTYFAAFDRIDVLVNCAGIVRREGSEFTQAGFADVIDVNLNGTQRSCAAAFLALKRAQGCIINTASMLTYFGSANSPAYSASKGGIGQFTKSLALAWAEHGIRVNALAPGWITTQLTSALEANPERSGAILSRTPMKRWGRPSDLVGPSLFLSSPGAAFITGVILPVDGGYSAA